MKYNKEIVELMAAYPKRQFSVRHFVRLILCNKTGLERGAVQRQVRRVLSLLVAGGHVETTARFRRDPNATYRWLR